MQIGAVAGSAPTGQHAGSVTRLLDRDDRAVAPNFVAILAGRNQHCERQPSQRPRHLGFARWRGAFGVFREMIVASPKSESDSTEFLPNI